MRNYRNRLISLFQSIDGILVAAGIAALCVGILVDVFFLRLVCFVVVVGSALFLYFSMRNHSTDGAGRDDEANFPIRAQLGSDEMKKLLFDDFQSRAARDYRVEEIDQRGSVFDPIAVEQPPSPTGAGNQVVQSFKIIKPELKPPAYEFQVSDFFDVDSDIFKGDAEPRTEFDFLLNKVLSLVKDVVFAHSVAFFWANREKRHMVMEARLTDSGKFMSSRRFPVGHDLVSKVAETGKPELITEVNSLSEGELFPYYETPAGVRSFAGVPVFFSSAANETMASQPVAVMAVDSKVEGAFGDETLALLGQFTKLISALIKNYTDKYDLLLDSEVLSAIRRIQDRLQNDFSIPTVLQSLPEEATRLVNWDFLSVVLYDENKRAWTVKRLLNRVYEPYIAPEQVVDFPESIIGRTIKNNIHYVVEDLAATTLPRYHDKEQAEYKGSFLSLPICSINKCYGALAVESREPHSFARRETEVLARLTEPVGLALDLLFLNEVVKEYVVVDDTTGVFSRKFFRQRMDEELQRADDGGVELSMLQITVDHPQDLLQRYGQDGFDRVMMTLAKGIRSSVRSYDCVGRLESNRFGILLVNTAANDAYVWAEKIRKNVAGHVINHDGKSFSVTISIGVAGALEGMKREELLSSTAAVLSRATDSGGNTVRVF